MTSNPPAAIAATSRRPTGLTATEVSERVSAGHVNASVTGTSRSVWEIVRANVFTRFNAILGGLFVLILITRSWADGLFGLVLVINSAIGIGQEYLAKRKLDRLALLNAPTATVVRDGAAVTIATTDVVLDDLVELRTGDQVPADGVLDSVAGLEVDESNLTGESDAIAKSAGDEVRSGTTVVAGSGRFFASAVGADSYANRITAEARKFTRTHSEIQSSINTLLKYITWVIVIALPLQLFSQARAVGDQGWQQVVIRSTGGLVGLVPEGLVLLTSIAFLMAAVQLTRSQVLVQELPAVEGLARVDVVCLDKTGTLTVGDIAFEEVLPVGAAGSGPGDRPGDGSVPAGTDGYDAVLREALGAMADDPNANGTLKAIAVGIPSPAGWQRTATIAFNSARKWSAATFDGRGSWVLGAPDVLLPAADALRARVTELAETGRRVLLLVRADGELSGQDLPAGLHPAALVTLTEQVRPDAAETLAYFRRQGVDIKVISGDNPTTVAAIARRVGLDVDHAVDARTLGSDSEELREIAVKTTVFGRVSPEQKRALVNALKAEGHVAAMTGDGVNDALALKDADIGVAMGNGAQATKAVAQLVLLDGKFSHLPSVLAEGRRVIGNVERVANLFLAKNVMSLVAILSAAIAALPFPFLPRHLTLVSSVTIGIPAFFLALGPNHRRYLPGFLTRVLRFAVPAGAVAGFTVIVSYLWANGTYGMPPSERAARCAIPIGHTGALDPACSQPSTAATVALLVVAFWILVVLARPFKMWKGALIAALIVITVGAFTVPLARKFFDFSLPAALAWQSLLVGAVGAVCVEIVYRVAHSTRRTAAERAAEQLGQ
ncbi:MAG: ATPase [Actinobacteria bacterium 69-20]|nr:MAG: ATPase [Actinobacteria bacterium 69-20]